MRCSTRLSYKGRLDGSCMPHSWRVKMQEEGGIWIYISLSQSGYGNVLPTEIGDGLWGGVVHHAYVRLNILFEIEPCPLPPPSCRVLVMFLSWSSSYIDDTTRGKNIRRSNTSAPRSTEVTTIACTEVLPYNVISILANCKTISSPGEICTIHPSIFPSFQDKHP